jgi:adenine-specific DNA methylase
MQSTQGRQTTIRQAILPPALLKPVLRPRFPDTKYMGSKQALLPFLLHYISSLRFNRVLDAFSGSGCVAYALKQQGAEVHTNDFLKSAFHVARATIENNCTVLNEIDIAALLRPNRKAQDFINRTFANRYFTVEDNGFLDNLWTNIRELRNPVKRSLALAAACKAAMKKRPRGIFTFIGMKGWDGRKDLRMSMREQFLTAVEQFNGAVFSNRRKNKALCKDVFAVDPKGYDLIYIDPPYVSRFSDCDYTRRYHFVEGYCSYWKDAEILNNTVTKKIRSYRTDFSGKTKALEAFQKLFSHFRDATLAISYSSNGIPSEKQMIDLLRSYKRSVRLHKIPHLYSHGNHNHKVGDNNNSVYEYLFIAQ